MEIDRPMALKDRTDMKSLPLVKEADSSRDDVVDGVSRRRWLQLMGASTALGAAAAGCRYEQEVIQPFARRPEGYVPGVPVKKSALCEIGGLGRSLVATVFDGRPVKVDGNELLKSQSGGTTSLVQAITLGMYDPDRSRSVVSRLAAGAGENSNWEMFKAAVEKQFSEGGAGLAGDGAGLAVLSAPTSSPTVLRLKSGLLSKYPGAKWYDYAPLNQDSVKTAAKQLFGETLVPRYQFAEAKVILALDSDPFGRDLSAPEYSRDFMAGRDVEANGEMSRLWSVGSMMNGTAALADERMPLPTSSVGLFLADLEAAVSGKPLESDSEQAKFLAALAKDLRENSGKAVVVVGDQQPAEVHVRAMRLNVALGAIGSTVVMQPAEELTEGGSLASLEALSSTIDAGQVKGLLVLGANPVYASPGDLDIGAKIAKVPFSVHLGLYDDETSAKCKWHVNQAHCLESWTDARSADGTYLLGQPAIEPLFGGKSVIELLSLLMGVEQAPEELIQETVALSGKSWEKALHDGFVIGSEVQPSTAEAGTVQLPAVEGDWQDTKVPPAKNAELVFAEGVLYDGSFANNGWLQELPDPITKLTWGNAAIMSQQTATAWGLKQNQVANIATDIGSLSLPVHVVPGTAAGTVVVSIGYGRREAGRIGGSSKPAIRTKPVGVDAYSVRSADAWFYRSAGVQGSSTVEEVATTQEHHYVDTLSLSVVNERVPRLAREGSLDSYLAYVAAHGEGGHGEDTHVETADVESGDAAHEHAGDEHHESTGELVQTAVGMNAMEYGSQPGIQEGAPRTAQQTAEEAHHHHSWPELGGHHYPNFDLTPGPAYYDSPKWAMTIDLNKCTGCSACVTACQAENNIAIVGKPEVIRGRELHWIRVDRYFLPRYEAGTELSDPVEAQKLYENPKVVFQPVTCHHCEKAPCETVCPVAATVHSDEGLNDMVYNRCIGTRYCGNNCPFKVRRFNYHNYSNAVTFLRYPDALASLDGARRIPEGDVKLMGLGMNPEVSIRSRGVMEKCTFCVQRIQAGKINARNEGRSFRNGDFQDGEVTTACQDVCPTSAIVFGDASKVESQVGQLFSNPRSYAMLNELNIIPRLKYLARVRNPHPDLVPAGAAESAVEPAAHA